MMPSISASASSAAKSGDTSFGNVTQTNGVSQTTLYIALGVAALIAVGIFFFLRKK
jgi:LPXTG-motif cell wall-anchored protein